MNIWFKGARVSIFVLLYGTEYLLKNIHLILEVILDDKCHSLHFKEKETVTQFRSNRAQVQKHICLAPKDLFNTQYHSIWKGATVF